MSSASDTLSIRLALTGDEEVKAKLQAVGDSGDKNLGRVGAAADQASSKLQQSLTRWTYSLDPAARSQAELAKGSDVLNKSLASGLVTQAEHARLMQLL